jgi:hypothetical protein
MKEHEKQEKVMPASAKAAEKPNDKHQKQNDKHQKPKK